MRILPALVLPAFFLSLVPGSSAADKPNVLFIAIDDLRTELGAYGHPTVQSPRLDQLAAGGTLFTHAYCQSALCSPSRASLLSGLRPDTTGIYDSSPERGPADPAAIMTAALSLPEHFKNNGYNTLSIGKIFHAGSEDADAWTEERKGGAAQWRDPKNRQLVRDRQAESKRKKLTGWAAAMMERGPATEAYDAPDDEYTDGRVAQVAIDFLNDYKDKEPFFLAVGFLKPHLPLVAPKKYWDLYDRSKIEVPSRDEPAGAPEYSLVPTWFETRLYSDIPPGERELDDAKTREMIHGYWACTSFIDAQVGKILDELEKLGLEDDTIVIVWGDHGWKLGEWGDWSKYTNMEQDARVPLILRVPGKKGGQVSDGLVELIDMYPTLAELCGLEIPDAVEATSFAPLLDSPDRPWKSGALTQHYRGKNAEHMGYAVRDGQWRYVHWVDTETREIVARELYDIEENYVAQKNVADLPKHADKIAEWDRKLREGWKAFLPPAPPASDLNVNAN